MTQKENSNADDGSRIDDIGISSQPELSQELINHEINDIINNQPRWMIRYGVSLIGVLTLILVLAAWLIHYPDRLKTTMIMHLLQKNKVSHGEIFLNRSDMGKVAIGQDVIFQTQGSGREYRGKIDHIATLPGVDSTYSIRIKIFSSPTDVDMLTFKMDRVITEAQIITRERRLLEKLFAGIINKANN